MRPSERNRQYIEQYKDIAIAQRTEFGVPAAITLAQGLLESSAGTSFLAREGNNHFGIKCHRWAGESVDFNDTLPHPCYRKYESVEHSYEDHSRFLKGKRYARLYDLDVTDYRGWAIGLRDCGYAEDPKYPEKLIRIIELYELYTYDGGKLLTPPPASEEGKEVEEELQRLSKSHESTADKDKEISRRHRHTAPLPEQVFRPDRVAASADNE